jgi:hypothetical protein
VLANFRQTYHQCRWCTNTYRTPLVSIHTTARGTQMSPGLCLYVRILHVYEFLIQAIAINPSMNIKVVR